MVSKRKCLIEGLWNHPSGAKWCLEHTTVVDEAVTQVLDRVELSMGYLPPLAVVATGGYGRRVLAPYSDVDLTLVPLDESVPHLDDAVRSIFKGLHQAIHGELGLPVSYAYRLPADAPGLDVVTRTGLADARWVAGDRNALERLQQELRETLQIGPFILEKIEERERQMNQRGAVPDLIVSNLKEGAGGLRCFDVVNWIRFALDEEPLEVTSEIETILTARNLLHAASGRRSDTLSRTMQGQICDRLGVDLFEWLSELLRSLSQNHAGYLTELSQLGKRTFELLPDVLADNGVVIIGECAALSDAIQAVNQASKLGLEVAPVLVSSTKVGSGSQMAQALLAGASCIESLDRIGLLDEVLPELSACRYLIPTDSHHDFSVYRHTLESLNHLHSLANRGGVLGELYHGVRNLSTLNLALILHDVGKSDVSKPHAEAGAEVAEALCRRWRLDTAAHQDVVWLVRHHLEMAFILRMRDPSHPETAKEFATFCGSLERLQMLTLLTWADISAVSSHSMTPAVESFLLDLYASTEALLVSSLEDNKVSETVLRKPRRRSSTDNAELEQFLENLPAHYLLTVSPDIVPFHLDLYKKSHDEPQVIFERLGEGHASEITLVVPDRPGLLSDALGVIYAYDLSIHGIRAHTTASQPKIAIDSFVVTFRGNEVPTGTANEISRVLKVIGQRPGHVDDILRRQRKDPSRKQQILNVRFLEGSPGILEVRAPYGRGLAFRLSRLIAENGWNVVSARVGQWAGQGAAAFYLEDSGGGQLLASQVEAAMLAKV
ncbi:MAG: HD domain-containing protein [Armatimonadetes bacterium]|nr:HD domain-containing protein [Armatimonadota bacterium]